VATDEIDHLYAAAGTYTVTVAVEDDDGGVTVQSIDVTIYAHAC